MRFYRFLIGFLSLFALGGCFAQFISNWTWFACLTVLEAVHLVMLTKWNGEIFNAVSLLIENIKPFLNAKNLGGGRGR